MILHYKSMCQSKTVPEKKYLLGIVLDFIFNFSIVKYKKLKGWIIMPMMDENTKTYDDMMRKFSIDELIYIYYTGELEIFLRRIEKYGEAEAIASLNTRNAFILVELYKILGLDPYMTEDEIRRSF